MASSGAHKTQTLRSDASYGGLAQLGERLHGMQEVTGSIPVFSTTKTCQRILAGLFYIFLHIRLLAHPACKEPIRFVTRRVKHLAMLADALRVEPGVQPALVAACSL